MSEPNQPPVLEAHALSKHYRMGSEDLHVLRGVDLTLQRGQWLSIVGRSGSGKSTLLHLLGGLDEPSQGRVIFDGQDLAALREWKRDAYRARRMGFVFQSYHLLPELSALENVLIAGQIGRKASRERAEALLERVGLKERLKHRPGKLSGGERQRVSIARALVNEPDVLLADEPTGNLDAETGAGVMQLLTQLHAEGQTLVLVTHDDKVAKAADQVVTLVRGALVE